MKKQISFTNEERITLQTLIARQIRQNRECEKYGIEPYLRTKDLKNLYQKIAGYSYEER